MEAGKLWLLRDLIGKSKVIFRIPVYQRNYDWSEANCNRLLDDIDALINKKWINMKHFLGTIVLMNISPKLSLSEYIIIDGQQRLTTMMLILKALMDISEKKDVESATEINEQYLHNRFVDNESKIKLKLIKMDSIQFENLLVDNSEELDVNGNIYNNYSICKRRIEEWISQGISSRDVLNALERLEIVEIVLDKEEDDPQIIFESINSTGLDLSKADLIRNFLLMNADNQEYLYETYWIYIEKLLRKNNDYSNLNLFFMQYVIYKTNAPLNMDRLYDRFVTLYKQEDYDKESILKELKYYAEIFSLFVYDKNKYSEKIQRSLRSLRLLKQTTSYPLLFHIFNDFENKVIDELVVERVLELLVSYLLRRMVCGVPSNSLRGLFIYLYNRVFKVEGNKKMYYESINKFLSILTSKDAIPSDDEFVRALKRNHIYNNSVLCKYLLMEIENHNGKELLDIRNLTIEHIMPQTLNSDWNYINNKEHEEYVHTIGNLTVSGYNSELSNKSFTEKKNIIIENSKAIILNKDVIDKETWGIKEITDRSERMAKTILLFYPIEKISNSMIEFEYITHIDLHDYKDIRNKKLVNFKFDNEIYRQNQFTSMLVDIIKLLDKKKPNKLMELANLNFSCNVKKTTAHISNSGDNLRAPLKIKENVYIETNMSSFRIMRFIEMLIYEFGLDLNIFSVSVISEEENEDNDD